MTIKEGYPFPSTAEQSSILKVQKIFSTMGFNSGYYQVNLSPESYQFTLFVVDNAQYELLRLLFGLVNAPLAFQRIVNDSFSHLSFIKIFLDDLPIYSDNDDEHYAHLEEVFNIVENVGCSINMNKCKFFRKEIEYLGIVVNEEGVTPLVRGKINLTTLTTANNKKKLQRLLGLVNWYRPFVHNLSEILLSIMDLFKGDNQEICSNEQQEVVIKLNKLINNAPIHAHPDYRKAFTL